jgi:hypothetical protein
VKIAPDFADDLAAALDESLGIVSPADLAALDYYAKYENDPIGFIETELKMELTEEQCAIALSVRDHRETNVQAAHGVGKTALAGALVIWYVLALRGMAITTAPTQRQVKKLLWGEIRKHYSRRQLPGVCNSTDFKITEKIEASGFTASDTNKNAFQGVHEDKLLVVEDEACGISADIDEGASACVTGARNRMFRIGNPVVAGGPFERSCKQGHIRIPAWNHPNVAWAYRVEPDGVHRLRPEVAAAIVVDGEVLPPDEWPDWCPRDKIPGAISISWIEEVRQKYGEGSSYWQSRVEGYFPQDSGASIIPRSWFAAARARYDADPDHWDALADIHPPRYGLDVGDGGDDHAIGQWRGPVLYFGQAEATKGDREDVTRAAGLAVRYLTRDADAMIAVDRGGVGAGALAILLEQGRNAQGFFWGDGAESPSEFYKLKTEQYWQLREAFRLGEVAVAPLGASEEMIAEDLSGVYWEEQSTGQVRIEDKAKTRKRLGRSPNIGDAIVLGYHCRGVDSGYLRTGDRASIAIARGAMRRR